MTETQLIGQEERDMAERILNVVALYNDHPANSVRDWIARFLAKEMQSVHAKAVEQTWKEAAEIVASHLSYDSGTPTWVNRGAWLEMCKRAGIEPSGHPST